MALMDEIRVESTFDEASAHAAAGLLRANNIPARVIRGDAALAVMGPTGIGGFDVLVPVDHERAARELLGTEGRRR
jgi:transglutaminase-like putative cysteine protease